MLIEIENHRPTIEPGVFIADTATVIGKVSIGPMSSIWFGTVLRGDVETLTIGAETNIQDLTMVHADTGIPTKIGDRVTVGHRAIVHGCTLEDECLVGMGSIVQNRALIRKHSIVASGSVVREGFEAPSGMLVAGVPATVKRQLTKQEIEYIARLAAIYVDRLQPYLRTRR